MGVALARMAPHAAPDPIAIAMLVATVVVLLTWKLAPLKVMAGGAVVGLVRNRLCDRAALCMSVWGR
jgi:hypothetical protein